MVLGFCCFVVFVCLGFFSPDTAIAFISCLFRNNCAFSTPCSKLGCLKIIYLASARPRIISCPSQPYLTSPRIVLEMLDDEVPDGVGLNLSLIGTNVVYAATLIFKKKER